MKAVSILKSLSLRSDSQLLAIRPLLQDALEVAVSEEVEKDDHYVTILKAMHKFVCVQSISLLRRNGSLEQLVLTASTSR